MAFDLALRRQNNLNLTFVSGDSDSLGRGTPSLDSQAKTQLAAFAKRVNTLNKTISDWYHANKTNPAAGPFANRWINWRNQAYGYIKAYTPALAARFLGETPPKEKQLLSFYSDWMKISGTRPISVAEQKARAARAASSPAPAPTVKPSAAKAPPPKKLQIRTPKSKATPRPASPTPSPFTSSAPLPPPIEPEQPGKGRLALIGGAIAAALGGAFLLTRQSQSSPRAPRSSAGPSAPRPARAMGAVG
jgi:hypothetical protein